MARESSVLVRLRLLGAQSFSRDAHRAGASLGAVQAGARRSQSALAGIAGTAAVAGRALATGIGVAGGAALYKGAKATVAFDAGMRNVNSIAQLSEERLASLSKGVLNLAGPTAQAPQTLAAGLYDLVSSGFDANESLHILGASARAATAGLTDTETSTAAVAAVLNAYRLPASAAGKVSDQLFRTVDRGVVSFEALSQNIGDTLPMASALGVGLDQVGASVATMTKQGIGAPETMTRIRAVMTSMMKPGKALNKQLREQGFSSGAAMIKAKGFQGALDALAEATGGSQAKMAALFPNVRALSGALALTGINSKVAAEDLAGMRDASGATAKALSQQSKSISFQWNRLKATASATAITLGQRLVPAANSVFGAMNKIMAGRGGVGSAIKSFAAGVRGGPPPGPRMAPGPAGDRHMVPAPELSAAQRAGMWIRANVPKIGNALKGVGRDLRDAFAPAMPFITNVVLPVLGGIAKGVIGGVVVAFRILVPLIKIVATAFGFVGTVLAPLKPLFGAIGTVIGFFVGGPILALLGGLGKLGIVFRLLAIPIRVTTGAFRLVVGAVGRVLGVFGRALTGVQRFVGTFSSMPARVIRAALNVVGGVVRTIGSLPGKIIGFGRRAGGDLIMGLARAAQNKLTSLASTMGRVGKAIVEGITQAIKDAPAAIMNAVLSIIPGPLKSAARKVLGFAGLASGGVVKRSGLAIVGERGPELARLSSGTTVYDAQQTADYMSTRRARASAPMATAPPLYLTANLHLSGKQIHSEVFRVDRQLTEAT